MRGSRRLRDIILPSVRFRIFGLDLLGIIERCNCLWFGWPMGMIRCQKPLRDAVAVLWYLVP